MISILRLVALALSLIVTAPFSAFANGSPDQWLQDLSSFRVSDTHAGYFDIAARRATLAGVSDTQLLTEMAEIRAQDLCPASRGLIPISGQEVTPRFYEDRDGWERAASPYHSFEDMVSKLGAQQFLAPASEAGDCLLALLDRWAEADAFLGFEIKQSGRQTWYQIESSLFAAAFGYALVRDDLPDQAAAKARIEAWLVSAARKHLEYPGTKKNTCCNNHFYRRALYAAMIGVLAKDDDLFRVGISAVVSAITDAQPDGSLPLEMQREQYAAKYQVYATMYLVLIAEVAARQGYDLYALEHDGRRLDDVVSYALAAMLRPETAAEAARTPGQHDGFLDDSQYFAWLEVAGLRPKWRATAEALLAGHRPNYNRSLGGFLTLYFMPLTGGTN